MGKQGVFILAEVNEDSVPTSLTLELLGLGGRLASGLETSLHMILPGKDLAGAARELARYPAHEVIVMDDPSLSRYDPEIYEAALTTFLETQAPLVLLAGHTVIGQDLFPRLAFSLDCGLVTDCTDVSLEGREILFTRPVYGGNALATRKSRTPTAMATVRARVGEAPSPGPTPATVSYVELDLPPQSRMAFRGREFIASRECPLEEAQVVVCGGRGMGGEEGFEQLRELATMLGGAVGASRPPVDSGWAPSTCQVGITGKLVAPGLYLAVAVSGSTQHLSGMSESGRIVAINRDPDAFIFKVSDYGLVGDWRQVLPAFTAALKDLVKERG